MAQRDDAGTSGEVSQNSFLDVSPWMLFEVFRRVDECDRLRHLPLVSRAFSAACRDPALWPELHVTQDDFPTEAALRSFITWLTPRASGLKTFVLSRTPVGLFILSTIDACLPELVVLLATSAPQLRRLEYWNPWNSEFCPVAALPAVLGQLSQLTSLTLGLENAPSAARVEAMLQGLPSLLHLHLYCISSPELHIPGGMSRSCSALESLIICGAKLGNVTSDVGELRSLTQLTFKDCRIESLPDSISQLTGLREVDLRGDRRYHQCNLPAGMAACRQLTSLELGHGTDPVLPSLQSLRSLSIGVYPTWFMTPVYWTQLTALTSLCLQMQPMRFFPGIAGMTGLRKVEIISASISDISFCTHLNSMTSLRMFWCEFPRGVPVALQAAVQLRVLDLRRAYKREITLSDSDLEQIGSLPALEELHLTKPSEITQQVWDERVAVLLAKWTKLGRAPPAVHTYPYC